MVNQFMRSEQRRNTFGMAERTVLTTTSVEEVPRKIRFLRFRESAKAAKSSFLLFWSGTLRAHQMIFWNWRILSISEILLEHSSVQDSTEAFGANWFSAIKDKERS
jgi:hypothetical protein